MHTTGRSLLQLVCIKDQCIGGKYCIKQELGQGVLSAVYLAQSQIDATPVTVTLFQLPESFSQDEATRFMSRFLQEAAALTRLSHPSILPIYDYGEYEGYPYLVSGYVEGRSLADLLKTRGRYSTQEALFILEQVAAVLDYAHQHGVTHLTLKPANILFDGNQLVLAGLGLTRIVEIGDLKQETAPQQQFFSIAGTYIGLPEYLAPEWISGYPIGASADIYALGVILFEMLTGKPPFTGSDFLQVARSSLVQPFPSVTCCPDLPDALDSVLQQATCALPELRFKRAQDLVAAYISATGQYTSPARHCEDTQSSQLASEPGTPTRAEQPLAEVYVRLEDTSEESQQVTARKTTRRTVPLGELHIAPWLETAEADQQSRDGLQECNEIRSSDDISQEIEQLLESALATQPPFSKDESANPLAQALAEQTVALIQAPERDFANLLSSIKALFASLPHLFRGNAATTRATQEFVCQQVFSAVSENFPARVETFAPRKDTFSSSRSDEGSTKNTSTPPHIVGHRETPGFPARLDRSPAAGTVNGSIEAIQQSLQSAT